MPLAEQLPALVGRVVAPVGELRANHHDPTDLASRRCQAYCTTAETVPHHVHRLTWEMRCRMRQHGFKIQPAPVAPGGLETTQRRRPGFADATVVVGQHIAAVGEQVVGKAGVIAAAYRRGSVDDHQRALGVRLGVAPAEAAEAVSVGRGVAKWGSGLDEATHGAFPVVVRQN